MKRVVITGIGAVTPLGNNFKDSWNSLIAGKNGISFLKGTNKDIDSNVKIIGALKGFNADKYLGVKEIKRLDPFIHYAVSSAYMALKDASLLNNGNNKYDIKQAAVIVGSSRGGVTTINNELNKLYRNRHNETKRVNSSRLLSPYVMPSTTNNMASSYI